VSVVRIKSFVSARVKHCRAVLAERNLDALIVVEPSDVTYLTGFSGEDSVVVLTGTRRILVTDTRFTLQVRQEYPGLALHIRKGSIESAVAQILQRQKSRRRKSCAVGIQTDSVTTSQLRAYRKAVGKLILQNKPILAPLRMVKDDYEIGQIRRAVQVAQDAMKEVLTWVRSHVGKRGTAKSGISERELAARLEYEMARRGSTVPAFPSIVAVGGHAAQPHAIPGKAKWRQNQSILFDWGATVNGYRSDLTRCFVLGRIRPVFAEAYQRLLEAQLAAIEEVRDGVPLGQVDGAARKVLKGSRWPMYGHGTGHGLGLKIHEAPFLKPSDNKARRKEKEVLREGMVITVEPGIYVPDRFGIRIEDDVLVTKRGAKVLTSLAKDLDSVKLE
jgi:Xaa-Pro aminopeptidase